MSMFFLWRRREVRAPFSAQWLKLWVKRTYRLPSLIVLTLKARWCELKGASLGDMVVIEAVPKGDLKKLHIGSGSFLARDVHLALHNKIVIGENSVINRGAMILTAGHRVNCPNWTMYSKPVIIGDYVWVAMNAIILPGVRIGRGAIIGAGAVVRENVPENAVVIGNPAQIVGRRQVANFEYCPAAFTAAVEAWVGVKNYG